MTDETNSLIEKGLIPRSAVPRNTVQEKPVPLSGDRITVVESISYTSLDGVRVPPVESRYVHQLKTRDQPYQRSFRVGENAVPLDIGWAREWPEIGLIHVSNDEGKNRTVIPSPSDLAELAKKMVELGGWLIPPGKSMRGLPKDIHKVTIRSQHGTARVTVTVYPA